MYFLAGAILLLASVHPALALQPSRSSVWRRAGLGVSAGTRFDLVEHLKPQEFASFLEHRRLWQEYMYGVMTHGPSASATRGRGVVIVGGRRLGVNASGSYTLDALLSVAALRNAGCRLPVEMWHDHDPDLLGSGERPPSDGPVGDIVLRDFWDIPGGKDLKGFRMKSYAVAHSEFAEVLFLDADNVVVVDPTPLFESEPYVKTGAVFWPDSYHSTLQMVAYSEKIKVLTGRDCAGSPGLDTGMILVNRTKHWAPLALADYFVGHGPEFYFNISDGDKDLWRYAWFALGAPHHLVESPMLEAGYTTDGGDFCGHTYLQSHPALPGEIVFAHRNLHKFSMFLEDDIPRWTAIKQQHGTLFAKRPAGCVCQAGSWATRNRCMNFPKPVDTSESSQHTLQRLASVEKDMYHVRSVLLGSKSVIRPDVWARLSESIAA